MPLLKEMQLQLRGRSPGTLPPRTGMGIDSPSPASPAAATGSGRSWDPHSGPRGGGGGGMRLPNPTAVPQLFPVSGTKLDGGGADRAEQTELMVRCAGEQKGGEGTHCPHVQLGKMCLPLESKNSESERSKPGGLGWQVPGALRPHCRFRRRQSTAAQKHTDTLKALLQLNHLVSLEEMAGKHNSGKTRVNTAF